MSSTPEDAAASALPASLASEPTLRPFLAEDYDASGYAAGVLRAGAAASCTAQLNAGLAAVDAELRAGATAGGPAVFGGRKKERRNSRTSISWSSERA